MKNRLTYAEILQLKRWNTPTIYNGWEQITSSDAAKEGFNIEEVRDFMPQMGTIAGYAVTVICQPGNSEYVSEGWNMWSEYRKYVAGIPGPKIVVLQDLDKPFTYGSFWGEVNASIHKALGCVGTITDGAVRDLDEMTGVGFKALAKRLCVGHAHAIPLKWNCEVEVFGTKVRPGQFIIADKHGFLCIPEGEEMNLLEAANFMDENECKTFISAARDSYLKTPSGILEALDRAAEEFSSKTEKKFGKKGEWK